jgi:CheY-like chemotaxis protein/Ser/Thr protein kinase RdoA (MazF antagonist)
MRILLVEDDKGMAELLHEAFAEAPIDICHVESRESALAALESRGPFDLAICDLKLPASDSSRDIDIAHGLAVCDHISDAAPGTPIIVFSSFGSLELLGKRLARTSTRDVTGGEPRPMLDHVDKGLLEQFVDDVIAFACDIEALHAEIEISWGGAAVDLTEFERRVLLIYARRKGGITVRARSFDGGRSSARTLSFEVHGESARLAGRVLGKINSLADFEDERKRYDRYVAPLLPAARYASLVEEVRAGAGDRGMAVYSLAGGDFSATLFDVLRDHPGESDATLQILEATTKPWVDAKEAVSLTLGDVRREMISDAAFLEQRARLGDAPVEDAEARAVYVFRTPAHGDLHGGNVLVDEHGNPLLIDFGRVGLAIASLDPVTLELSAVLHPDAQIDLKGWPTQEQAEAWASLDGYLVNCPISDFISKCRRWAYEVARGDREVLAAAYSYAARQLQYDSVDQVLAVAFARGAVFRLAA